MTLDQIANVVEILGVIAVISAIFFGWLQIRQHRSETRNAALIALASSFEEKGFTDAYRLISSLEYGVSLKELTEQGEEYEQAALRLGMKFETIGLMIYKGYVPIDALEDLVGGAALALWKVLYQYVEDMRADRDHPTFMEWFQWLVDRLKERGNRSGPPAYEAHKNWQPK
ncbi:MAG: hypothetical protein ABJN62_12170 [Halioglobus sp.]